MSAEIPWGHNLLILNKIKNREEREFYIKSTIEMGWSRNFLNLKIQNKSYERTILNKKQNNFETALPVHLAEQAEKSMKDIYMLDFLGITKPILEKELELKMVKEIYFKLYDLTEG